MLKYSTKLLEQTNHVALVPTFGYLAIDDTINPDPSELNRTVCWWDVEIRSGMSCAIRPACNDVITIGKLGVYVDTNIGKGREKRARAKVVAVSRIRERRKCGPISCIQRIDYAADNRKYMLALQFNSPFWIEPSNYFCPTTTNLCAM
jgi:hypothetical protein